MSGQKLVTLSVTVTPGTVTQGDNFQVYGTGFYPHNWFSVLVVAGTGGGCVGLTPLGQGGWTDASGNVGPVTFSSNNLQPGTHCVTVTAGNLKGETQFTVTAP